jgi:hypothetical protein
VSVEQLSNEWKCSLCGAVAKVKFKCGCSTKVIQPESDLNPEADRRLTICKLCDEHRVANLFGEFCLKDYKDCARSAMHIFRKRLYVGQSDCEKH